LAVPIIIGMPLQLIIIGIPIAIIIVRRSHIAFIISIVISPTGIILHIMPSPVISTAIAQHGVGIIIGIIAMPPIVGIVPGIVGVMPPIVGIVPGIVGVMPGIIVGIIPPIVGIIPGIVGIMPPIVGIMPGIIVGIMPPVIGIMPGIIGIIPPIVGIMPAIDPIAPIGIAPPFIGIPVIMALLLAHRAEPYPAPSLNHAPPARGLQRTSVGRHRFLPLKHTPIHVKTSAFVD